MTNLALRVKERAEREPERPFCTVLRGGDAEPVTFGALYRASLAYARAYRKRGLGKDDIVMIALRHGPHLFYSFVGALIAGVTPAFLPFPSAKQDPAKYWRDHEALFRRVEPALIVTFDANVEAASAAIPDFAIPTMLFGDGVLTAFGAGEPGDAAFPGLSAEANDVACLQHSSGTTGLKKGVMLTHAAIVRQIESYASRLALTDDDRIVSWLPLYHDMGFIACFLLPLVTGTHVIAMDPFEWVMRPAMLFDAIERYRGTLCWQPNFAFAHLVNTAKKSAAFDLSSMRAFVNCSEPCKAATFERFAERFAAFGIDASQLHVCYAMAENVFAVTQTPLGRAATVIDIDEDAFAAGTVIEQRGESARRALSCGVPIDGVTVSIRDERGASAPDDVIGEIVISSEFLFSGYYRQPDVTEKRLRAGAYATGDRGFMHAGELYVSGRVDDMIIVNGRNYYAHEIEDVVTLVPGVLPGRNVALAVDDERSEAAVVVVLAESAGERDAAALSSDIKRDVFDRMGLALHAVTVLPRGSLVKTTSGKLSRSENKKLYVDRS